MMWRKTPALLPDVTAPGLLLASLGGVILGLGCASTLGPIEDQAIQEFAIRWAFEAAETNLTPPAAYCLAVWPDGLAEPEDPEPALLDRFEGSAVPVRPVSACRFEGGTANSVVDQATGEYALLFSVRPVDWETPDRATILVWYLQGGLWGAGWRCTVDRTDGEWNVRSCPKEFDI